MESQQTSNPNSYFEAHLLNSPNYIHTQRISVVKYIYTPMVVYLEVPLQSCSGKIKQEE